jgi:hypothetical protein
MNISSWGIRALGHWCEGLVPCSMYRLALDRRCVCEMSKHYIQDDT